MSLAALVSNDLRRLIDTFVKNLTTDDISDLEALDPIYSTALEMEEFGEMSFEEIWQVSLAEFKSEHGYEPPVDGKIKRFVVAVRRLLKEKLPAFYRKFKPTGVRRKSEIYEELEEVAIGALLHKTQMLEEPQDQQEQEQDMPHDQRLFVHLYRYLSQFD
jgi:hypothetical protein